MEGKELTNKNKDLQRKKLGGEGEEIATQFLSSMGMHILSRNFRSGHKELDIVALAQNPLQSGKSDIHFVEVKTRREPVQGEAWEAVNAVKQQKLIRAARGYVASGEFRSKRIDYEEIVFDIVTIVWNEDGTRYRMEYFPDAFKPFFI